MSEKLPKAAAHRTGKSPNASSSKERSIEDTKVENPHTRESATRKSGTFGADEPAYGRRTGERPAPETGKKKPNEHGPQYEEGGIYPGTREPGEHDKI